MKALCIKTEWVFVWRWTGFCMITLRYRSMNLYTVWYRFICRKDHYYSRLTFYDMYISYPGQQNPLTYPQLLPTSFIEEHTTDAYCTGCICVFHHGRKHAPYIFALENPIVKSLWHSDVLRWHKSEPTLARIMRICCLTASRHCLDHVD